MAKKGRIHRSLRASIIEGFASSGMLGLVDTSLMPFAIAMNATAGQVAHLASLPNLVATLAQSQAASLSDWLKSRRKAILAIFIVQILSILLMAALAFLPSGTQLPALVGL